MSNRAGATKAHDNELVQLDTWAEFLGALAAKLERAIAEGLAEDEDG